MKKKLPILLVILLAVNLFSQDKNFCPTYVFEGNLVSHQKKSLKIEMNFLILLDSTIVGSYHYKPEFGALELVGRLRKDNAFNLVERNKNNQITGIFKGKLSRNKKLISGNWKDSNTGKEFTFLLTEKKDESYWNILKKNRALFEYKNFNDAIKYYDKVQSIDVANQNLISIPNDLSKLKKVQSINLLGNRIENFPEVLTRMYSLDEISLSSNGLKNINPNIKNLKNLKILILNFNNIKILPRELGELSSLLYLDIGDNDISEIPVELKNLTKLQELHVDDNNLSEKEKNKLKKLLPNCVIYFKNVGEK